MRPVRVLCNSKRNHMGKCSRTIGDFIFAESSRDDAVFDGAAMQTMEAYICPRRTDWPVYDATVGEFVTCSGPDDDRESMLKLSATEAASLQLAEVYVDYKREAGKVSKGPTFNYKK